MTNEENTVGTLLENTILSYKRQIGPLQIERNGLISRIAVIDQEIKAYETSIAAFEEYLNGNSAN